MNKICTYVGTTLCTILFFLTTAQGQNNKPVQVVYDVATSYHQPIVININQVLSDPDGDRMFINTAYTQYNANGFVAVLSDTTLRYSPISYICGPGMLRFSACDTSLVYNNSKCDTFVLNVDDECTWPPLVVNTQPQTDTVCNQTGHGYMVAPSGGSGIYRYELTSTNPLDIAMPNSTSIIYNGWGDRSLMLKVVDELSGDSVEGILLANVYVHRNYEGYIDTDTTFHSGMRFIVQQQLQPQEFGHSISWWNADTVLMQSTSTDPGLAQQYVDQAMIFCPDTSGFYFISLHDFHTDCVYYAEAYYTGINHPLNNDAYSWTPYYTLSNGQPLHIENYLVEPYGYCVERIRYTDIVTSPVHGTISYIDGEMYYTPNGSCGVDTFWAIGCDTSKYLPHSTCDTIMVEVEVSCVLSVQAFVVQNPTCNGFADGAVSVTVQGTNGNANDLTYLWSNGATTQTITGLVAGTYSVTVTYQNLTTATSTAIVTQPQALQPSVQVQNTCGASCSGSATVSIVGGTAPYTYIWSHNSTAPNLSNLCIGTYAGTITDAMGCTVSTVFTILQDTSPITINLTEQHIDCDSAFGSITAMVNNGIAPYSYMWSTGESGLFSSIHMLSAGNYSLTVVDANGCAATASTAIVNSTGLSASIIDSLLPTCNGATNGMVQIMPTGGVAPYTYVWTGNASTTNTATGLSAGAHTVVVSDNGGCSFAYQFNLAPQIVLNVSTTTVSANCIPNALGQINVQVGNGTPPYSYGWNTGTTGAIMVAPAGIYQLTVTDANSCSAVNTASIINHSLFMSAYSQPENCGQSNGKANVVVYNGVSPFSYEWNNNIVLSNDTLYNANNGIHTVKVTDALGCYRTVQIEVLADCYAVLEGTLYNDANRDCIKQIGETQPVAQSTIVAVGVSNTYYGTIYPNGNYAIVVRDTGNYELGVSLSPCFVICPTSVISVPALNNTYAINSIGIQPSLDEHDFKLSVNISGWANPGFSVNYNISITSTNNPHNILPSVTVNYSPHLSFVNAANAITDTVAHTITWSNVQLNMNGSASLVASFDVPVSTPIGLNLINSAIILPDSNDCNPQNNSVTFTRIVTGSYDPNMKVANPAADILETDSVLHYTIHFQNTGNDTTHFVILKDTLSELVDPASFEFGGSSHQPCRYEVSGTGILTFTFDPLYLVDSATNEEASKGYVNYSIKKKPSAEVGAVIKNTAHIYFDFNPAIVTNTTENEVTTLVSIRDIKADDKLTAKVYPNPFAETATIETSEKLIDARLVINNLAGQVVQEYKSENGSKWQISKQGLAQGMYTFAIYSYGKVVLRGKLVAE